MTFTDRLLGLFRTRRPGLEEVIVPAPWDGWPAGWQVHWTSDRTQLETNLGIVFACVDRIASALSTMPLTAVTDRRPMARPPRWLTDPPAPTYTHTGEAVDERP